MLNIIETTMSLSNTQRRPVILVRKNIYIFIIHSIIQLVYDLNVRREYRLSTF